MVGYTETLSGIGAFNNGTAEYSTNVNQKLNGNPIILSGRLLPIVTSSRVLTSCVEITTGGPESYAQMEGAQWSNLPHSDDGDVPGTKPFTSSHMANPRVPSGVNLGMFDGHVEWRPFKRTIARGAAGLTFYF